MNETKLYEIIAYDGRVHRYLVENHPDIIKYKKLGYSIRSFENYEQK